MEVILKDVCAKSISEGESQHIRHLYFDVSLYCKTFCPLLPIQWLAAFVSIGADLHLRHGPCRRPSSLAGYKMGWSCTQQQSISGRIYRWRKRWSLLCGLAVSVLAQTANLTPKPSVLTTVPGVAVSVLSEAQNKKLPAGWPHRGCTGHRRHPSMRRGGGKPGGLRCRALCLGLRRAGVLV